MESLPLFFGHVRFLACLIPGLGTYTGGYRGEAMKTLVFGKVIGGLIGLAAGGIFGLIVGALVGHAFDRGLG